MFEQHTHEILEQILAEDKKRTVLLQEILAVDKQILASLTSQPATKLIVKLGRPVSQ